MRPARIRPLVPSLLVALILTATSAAWPASAAEDERSPIRIVAQASGEEAAAAGDSDGERRGLEPTYAPREPEQESWYNSDYLFGMTRGVAGSTIHPAGKVPLFVLTVPLDIVFLPFAAIGGLFG